MAKMYVYRESGMSSGNNYILCGETKVVVGQQ